MREENEVDSSHGEAFRADAQRRYWDALVAKHRAIRRALPVGEQVLNIGNLETFSRNRVQRGREAWAELYASLAALASLDEVAAVAPGFADHLRAAAECLLPMVRGAPVVVDAAMPADPNPSLSQLIAQAPLTPRGAALLGAQVSQADAYAQMRRDRALALAQGAPAQVRAG